VLLPEETNHLEVVLKGKKKESLDMDQEIQEEEELDEDQDKQKNEECALKDVKPEN
jgi:hypothetical protein